MDKADAVNDPADGDDLENEINTSLNDVLDLLGREVERLKLALEFCRLSDTPDKDALIRWHVREIDARQDRMDEIKTLILAGQDGSLH